MNTPNVMLKVIVLVHFILSVWATMGGWLPTPYFYVHIALFVCGLWAIASSDSIDAIMMMLMVLAFSILQDIILLSLYEPRGYNSHERDPKQPQSVLNEYRFALGMCILNLILKPFTGFLLLRICQARSNDTAFNIPGIDRIPGLGGMGGGRGYEDIDNRQTSGPYSSVPVESAEAHSTVDKE
ncbi:type-1 angiotensin II receptor-associated protein-like [Littorina saxatilis]|uniref:Type-1 angiotensin II receptor-associated protein n=1 Tax=Littorina saxatilis TaxID=31220 RepID=A0AAN9AUU5_9CAEN